MPSPFSRNQNTSFDSSGYRYSLTKTWLTNINLFCYNKRGCHGFAELQVACDTAMPPSLSFASRFLAKGYVVYDLETDLELILHVILKEQTSFHWIGVVQGGSLLLSLPSTCVCSYMSFGG